jgi:hypothetical protein
MPWIDTHNEQSPIQWMLFVAVFLLSLSSLSFEVLLTRIFSISQWHHLTFMVLSIALFGFAASGSVSSILGAHKRNWQNRYTSPDALLLQSTFYAIGVIGAFIGLNRLPLDYFKIPVEPIQVFYLALAYLLLTLPFFLTGFVISLSFSRIGTKAGLIYFATMAGSACGAVLPMGGVGFTDIGILIIGIATLPVIGLLICLLPPIGWYRQLSPTDGGLKPSRLILLLALVVAVPVGAFFRSPDIFRIRASDYKALSQLLQFPETHVKKSVHGIRGRFDVIDSQYNRFAPGLSLTFTTPLPRQTRTVSLV